MKPSTFIGSFYISRFFFDFILIYAVEKLFFLSRGVNLSQIGVLLFLWSVMTLVLEVPTGIIADHWSRRKMLVLSGLFFSICYLVWIFSNSFWIFLLGFFFRTLGSTFTSGTLQAYVYDFLKLHHQENSFEKIWGRGNALRTLGIGFAVFLGGFLSQISYSIPLIISAASILIITAVALFWPEIPSVTSTSEENYWHFFKSSLKTIHENCTLLRVFLYSIIIFSVFSTLEEFNDVYLNFLGFPNSTIGIIFALATIGQSIASAVAHKFKSHSWITLDLIAAAGILILVSIWLIKLPVMAIAVLFLGVMLEFSRVLNEGIIQKEAPPQQRATLASVNSFVSEIIPLQLAFGFIADHYHFQLSYAFLAAYGLIYFLAISFTKFSPFVVAYKIFIWLNITSINFRQRPQAGIDNIHPQ